MGEHFFPGETEMARRMRALDWSKTPLGPAEHWPQSLRTSVSICLDCAFPIVLWWGPELAILYNDEYSPMLGPAKHPAALGQPGAKVWAEIWDVIAPMLSHVVERGEATRSRDLLLHIDREGYPEEAYFSFSYGPILDDQGKVGGVFCPVIETTEKVIGERRLRTLRDLAAKCKGAESETAAYEAAAQVLEANPFDLPFALLYEVADDRSTARLAASAGIAGHAHAAPPTVALGDEDAWSLGAVARSGDPAVVANLAGRFECLPSGAWKVPPHQALVLPMLLPGQGRPRGLLVAGVSPMRALDDAYRTFFGLVATQIAAGLADAQALEAERRRAEALAEIDRAKTTFFSNVSHEFRTPLTLMLGPLEDALANAHGQLPKEAAATLAVAHRNSLRLLKLVNALLDFSRIEAGRVEASYEPTDLAALTADLASVFRSAIERAGLELVVDCPPLRDPAYVDRDMWEKVVLNLLSNALKFTFDGKITVALHARGERIELAVTDTGVGISEADLPKMFQRFQRVKNARSRTHEGSGIGLALVSELVKLHGGEVAVRSREGAGTTFIVAIPAGQAHLPAGRIGTARLLPPTSVGATPYLEEALRWLPGYAHGHGGGNAPARTVIDIAEGRLLHARRGRAGARILLADDNADMREYVRRLLEQSYDVEAVADGEAALARIRAEPPDLVLTDVMMPRLDGFSLLAEIRAEERTRTLPVVMLSARAGEEARIEGLGKGADDYLTKPFSARELLARVGSQLELARLRRETEQALRYRGEQFETLLQQAPLGVYVLDAEFKIRHINPLAAPAFGEVEGGLVGRDFSEVMHAIRDKEHADDVVRVFRHTLETGEPFVAREPTARPRGNVTEYYDWRVDRIALPEGRHGVVCYFRDVTAQVAARKAIEESREALREADRRKDEFLATLAHELRTPLAPIRNSLNILRVGGHDGDATERVYAMMERQVSHMVRLVDDLMEVSRITRGKIELRKETVELAAVMHSAIETSRPLIESAGHHLTIELPTGPLLLEADPVRLAQVLANLLNNAAKYTQNGGKIWLSAKRDDANVVISVRDTGTGIPPDALPRVFDLFMQAERTYHRAQGGLGIGLTLVRSLVHLHGGTVEAKSGGLGCGSEFIVSLPLAAEAVDARGAGRRAERRRLGPLRILVVDDNRDAAASLGMLLEFLGAHVEVANDGPAALEAFRSYRPSVAVLDIGMPGMDGYEVARRARQIPGAAGTTLIALTGWGYEEDRRRSREAGIDHHLIKPVELGVLEELLASLPARAEAGKN
jgi:PAS domain S-box-containing protein